MSDYFADVSSNNGSFHAGAYKSGGDPVAVMVKATEGEYYTNPFYAEWVRDAHAHGLPVFHYLFARPENGNPTLQAAHFWQTIRPHFRRPGDFVVIDLETDTPRNGALWLPEADQYLIRQGLNPWCYTFLSYFEEGRVTVASKNIHLAAWGNRRPGNALWQLPFGQKLIAWQFTDGRSGPGPHSVAGIPGLVDGSYLNPSLARHVRKQLQKGRK